jgi:hypothetical protein
VLALQSPLYTATPAATQRLTPLLAPTRLANEVRWTNAGHVGAQPHCWRYQSKLT